VLDGRRFPVVGVNAYYLMEEAARELDRGHKTSATVQEVLGELASLDATVVRTWAFHDGDRKPYSLQPRPEAYNDKALRGLDHVVAQAERQGLKLILTLVNYWPEYGGVDQYLRWHGKPAVTEQDRGLFFSDPQIRAHFKRHITFLVSRSNRETGRPYRQEPAILGWELMNEGRGSGASMWWVASWLQEMTGALRDAGIRQLVSSGDSGYDEIQGPLHDLAEVTQAIGAWAVDGSMQISYSLNLQLVDFGTVHCYPEVWQVARDRAGPACRFWIRLHGRIARGLGRPAVCTEIGLVNREQFPEGLYALAERRTLYRSWFQGAEQGEVAGVLPWLYIPDGRPAAWDRHSFGLKNGTRPEDPGNQYTDLIKAHGAAMKR
jgi:mannan endo-1,4-beta-mannosidase